jgi:hypothetical protein
MKYVILDMIYTTPNTLNSGVYPRELLTLAHDRGSGASLVNSESRPVDSQSASKLVVIRLWPSPPQSITAPSINKLVVI